QMPFHGGPLTTSIVKMHGDLRHEEHIIVTEEDFNRYLEDYPVVATHLSAMLITRTGLFLGYSLSDPNFQHIKEVVRSRLGKFERMAYIVQFDASTSDTEKMLQSNLHPINLKTSEKKSRVDVLIEFFQDIQMYAETHEATRIRELRPETFEPLGKDTMLKTFKMEGSAAVLASSSSLCFVIMPFSAEYDLVYHQLIKPVAETSGLKVLRADDIYSPGVITEQIRAAIHQSRICIAVVSGKNPNVLYEVGIAHTLNKTTILLSQSVEQIPFDLRAFRVVLYDMKKIKRARENLVSAIQEILGERKLVEAEELLQQGNVKAAIAEASIYFEQALREWIYRNESRITNLLQGRSPERLGMGQMLEYLSKLGVVSKKDVPKIRKCVELRHRAVHYGLAEPSISDAKLFIEVASEFVEKYLGKDFNGK
ncbi:MAG: SIR2 family protein, partial [Thermoplasmatales archaeon]|nr:SIR2 family protein [Thermoplasmatales archaeon]